jgi:hypothetical protein
MPQPIATGWLVHAILGLFDPNHWAILPERLRHSTAVVASLA